MLLRTKFGRRVFQLVNLFALFTLILVYWNGKGFPDISELSLAGKAIAVASVMLLFAFAGGVHSEGKQSDIITGVCGTFFLSAYFANDILQKPIAVLLAVPWITMMASSVLTRRGAASNQSNDREGEGETVDPESGVQA